MLRRTELRRGDKPLKTNTPLKATKPLERHHPLPQVGRKRREEAETTGKPVKPALSTRVLPAVPEDVRKRLAKRSGGECEMRLPGCTWVATDPAHRIGRGSGGRHGEAKVENNQLSNLMHACRTCHDWTHDQDDEAKDFGLRLKDGCIPTREPVQYRGVLSYLDDEGGVHDFEDVGA